MKTLKDKLISELQIHIYLKNPNALGRMNQAPPEETDIKPVNLGAMSATDAIKVKRFDVFYTYLGI